MSLINHKDSGMVYSIIEKYGPIKYNELLEKSGLNSIRCVAILRALSHDKKIRKAKLRLNREAVTIWKVVEEQEHLNSIDAIQKDIERILKFLGTVDIVTQATIREMVEMDDYRLSSILRHMKKTGLVYNKEVKRLGKSMRAWSISDLGEKGTVISKIKVNEDDFYYKEYWSKPKHIRRTMPPPKINEF